MFRVYIRERQIPNINNYLYKCFILALTDHVGEDFGHNFFYLINIAIFYKSFWNYLIGYNQLSNGLSFGMFSSF